MTTLTTRPSRRGSDYQSYDAFHTKWADTLTNLKPFRMAASMRGGWRSGSWGWLPKEWQDTFYDDDPDYVVYSYETAIAWHGNRGWIVPDVKYSLTTTRHQSLVRSALHGEYDEDTGKTYSIVRHHYEGDRETIKTGLTLAEAQKHCKRPDTHGVDWFDGYTSE
jgi:hypothetical protein